MIQLVIRNIKKFQGISEDLLKLSVFMDRELRWNAARGTVRTMNNDFFGRRNIGRDHKSLIALLFFEGLFEILEIGGEIRIEEVFEVFENFTG